MLKGISTLNRRLAKNLISHLQEREDIQIIKYTRNDKIELIEENIKFMYLDENSPAVKLRRIKIKRKVKLATRTFRFWRLTFSRLFNGFPLSFIMSTGRTFGAILGINGTALQFLSIFQLGCILIFGPIIALIESQ